MTLTELLPVSKAHRPGELHYIGESWFCCSALNDKSVAAMLLERNKPLPPRVELTQMLVRY